MQRAILSMSKRDFSRLTLGEFARRSSAARVSPADPNTIRHEDVARLLLQMEAESEACAGHHRLKVDEIGRSYEDRPLHLASIGCGSQHVLMWTQMHGDEPTHTAVVLDLLNILLSNVCADEGFSNPLNEVSLFVLPMLNPDGAERWTRTNAIGIDINRDAVDLKSSEARVLASVVRTIRPAFAFNLHNQDPRKQVSETGRLATVSLLAPPAHARPQTTPSFTRAKQLAVSMFDAAERLLPGHTARYEVDYMPTAFGEWVQSQSMSTVLLEAGGWPKEVAGSLADLHLLLVLQALQLIADGDLYGADPQRYLHIPLNYQPDE